MQGTTRDAFFICWHRGEMKPDTNKEMELLLRRLARRGGEDLPVASERHMDADELNAYAALQVPAAARKRYTEHLADCAACREIVASLAASVGPRVAEEVRIPVQRSSFKQLLAGFFAPAFIRYAIPVLAIVGVVGLGLMVHRSREEKRALSSQVAQSNTAPGDPAPQRKAQDDNLQGLSDSLPNESASPAHAQPEAPAKRRTQEEVAANVSPSQVEPAATPAQQPVAAPEPRPATVASAASPKVAEVDQKKPAEDENARRGRDVQSGRDKEVAKKDARTEGDVDAAAASGPAKTEARAVKNLPARTPPATGGFAIAREEKQKSRGGETRVVAGRRFQRDGNAWVDTAYEEGTATTNVTRGSEQYRALIADEPAIRTIADTLSGEVVVVWKGRAYKLR